MPELLRNTDMSELQQCKEILIFAQLKAVCELKKKTWSKHHQVFGLIFCFFIVMFCLSGIVLNHPSWFSHVDVSRGILPKSYEYKNWNGGLLRGTIRWQGHVLIYGNNGVWLTDTMAKACKDFNTGMPTGTDNRNIRGMALMSDGHLFAAGTYHLYAYGTDKAWHVLPVPLTDGERLSDISTRGDTLVVTGRSRVYLSRPPYIRFNSVEPAASPDSDGKVSLFRTVWWLHSGELFGLAGKLIIDAIALVLLFLCITGAVYWLLPRVTKHRDGGTMRWFFRWHNAIGRTTIVLTVLLSVTGWLLRPPAMLLIVQGRIPAIPLSTMNSSNAWYDKLRSLRYDKVAGDWLLYTSEGFYSMKTLDAEPRRIGIEPPVSVMGLTVQKQYDDGAWLLGSFSGLYLWSRTTGKVLDCMTGTAPQAETGVPVSANAIAGFSDDLAGGDCVANYRTGTASPRMPQWMSKLPMSLRSVCLEIHTGRIYTFLGMGGVLYIFVVGLGIVWCLWTGWKIRRKRRAGAGGNTVK